MKHDTHFASIYLIRKTEGKILLTNEQLIEFSKVVPHTTSDIIDKQTQVQEHDN